MFESIWERIRDRIRRIRDIINGGSISTINFTLRSFLRAGLRNESISLSSTSSRNSSLSFSEMSSPDTRSLSFSEMESEQNSSLFIL